MRAPVLFLTLALLATGCGGSEEPATKKPLPLATGSALVGGLAAGEVMGRLVRAEGADGSTTPVRGTVTLTAEDGAVTRTQVDSGGKFRIQLSPGRYVLRGTSPDAPGARCVTDPPTTILREGEPTIADIVCPAD